MRAKYDAIDLMNFVKVSQGGSSGYWDENDNYAVTPAGQTIPYFEAGKRRGYQFHIAAGTAGINPFAEGAAAGSPGTWPTGWQVTNTLLGVTPKVAAVGTQADGSSITVECVGAATGAGPLFQINFGNFASPASLPTAGSGQNWTGEVHIRDENVFSSTGLDAVLGFTPFDSSNNPLTTTTASLAVPQLVPGPMPLRECRRSMRSGVLPAGTSRVGLFLRVDAPAATGSLNGIQLKLAMPSYMNRANLGPLLGRFSPTGLAASNGMVTSNQPLHELMRLPMWMNPEQGTFHVKFKLLPNPSNGTANSRAVFCFCNYVGSNLFFLTMNTSATPTLSVSSTAAGGNFTRTIKTGMDPSLWHVAMISYNRDGGVIIKSCHADESISPLSTPTLYTDAPPDLVPFLFGMVGGGGSAYITSRQSLNGYLQFFDYYPFLFSDDEMQQMTKKSALNF